MKHASVVALLALGNMWIGMRCVSAGEPTASGPMMLDFGRSCVSIATDDEVSRADATKPRLTPQHPPKLPAYPRKAGKRGQSYSVDMFLLVNEEGQVTQAKVLKSSGSPLFDQTSLEATRHWQLAPGTVNGKTRCMWFTFYLTARL
jgi:TonB family protein